MTYFIVYMSGYYHICKSYDMPFTFITLFKNSEDLNMLAVFFVTK